MRYFIHLPLLAILLLTACSSSRTGSAVDLRDADAKKETNATDVDTNSGVDLTSYLRRIPGVIVRGSGANAQVQVRGNSSFGAVSSPLFVVDGTIIGTDYSTLLSTVDPSDIARVRVLKDASETAAYGIQGGNGVLEFKLRKR